MMAFPLDGEGDTIASVGEETFEECHKLHRLPACNKLVGESDFVFIVGRHD